MDSEIMDPSYIFEKGTRYYLSVCANEIFYGEGNKYEYYPSSDLLVKINGQKANDMNSIWPDTELESIKNGVDNARYYIEFVANEKTKQTDLIYTIPESYEWTITATVADSVGGNTEIDIVNKLLNVGNQKNSDGKVQINVEVNNWTLDLLHKLDVSVESTNDWNMCDQAIEKFEDAKAANRCASYKIVSELDDTKTWEANPNLITVMGKDDGTGAKSTGFFEWGDDGIPGLAGTYKDTLTFTAEIKEVPKKGDLIYLDNDGDGKASNPYRIVKGNESNAEVLSLTKCSNEPIMYHNDDINEFHYSNSIVDEVLNKFYIELPEQMQNAIKDKTFNVYSYKGTDSTEEHMSTANINDSKLLEESITRKVYALDVVDIEEYFDYKGFTKEDLLAFSNVTMPSEDFGNDFWLRSGNRYQFYEFQNQRAYFIYGLVTDARVLDCWQSELHDVNPAFTIDLSKVHYTFAPEE